MKYIYSSLNVNFVGLNIVDILFNVSSSSHAPPNPGFPAKGVLVSEMIYGQVNDLGEKNSSSTECQVYMLFLMGLILY